ncbi:TcmI family type II polyketide cyclase, partial [Streptomyces sp. H27-H5]|nr:TcmI family type II polyketide cyclase [Streptomyces sp. H27-H5]
QKEPRRTRHRDGHPGYRPARIRKPTTKAITPRDQRSRGGSRLKPFIGAYDPATWRSPADAMAKRFYDWEASA